MTGNMKKTLASIFLFGSLSLSASASTTSKVSAISMTTMSGRAVVFSDYIGKGKWTIVEAWHSKCRICMKAMPEMVEANGTFANTALVGISLDGKRNRVKAQRVVKRFSINFPTLLTSIDEFAAYVHKVSGEKLVGVPTYLVFSPDGTLKAMQAGNVSTTELHAYINNLKQSIPTLKQTLAEQIIANQGEVESVSPE